MVSPRACAPTLYATLLMALLVSYLCISANAEAVSVSASSQGPAYVFATAFTKYGNNSLAAISPVTGAIVNKNTDFYDMYDLVAVDPNNRKLWMVGYVDMMAVLDRYDADSLEQVGNSLYLTSDRGTPTDIQYDSVWNKLIGVGGGLKGQFVFAEWDQSTGEQTDLIDLGAIPREGDIIGMSQYCSAYDTKNHMYYASLYVYNVTMPRRYVQIDVAARKIVRSIPVDMFIDSAAYDPIKHRLVGIVDDGELDAIATFDLRTGEYKIHYDTLDFSKYGFREIGGYAYDAINSIYYALFETHEAITTLIKADLKNEKFDAIPFYNHVGNMAFMPASRKSRNNNNNN